MDVENEGRKECSNKDDKYNGQIKDSKQRNVVRNRRHLLRDHCQQNRPKNRLELNAQRPYIARRESIPRESFSLLSLLVEAGVKNPVTETRVITDVGITKLTM